MKYSLEDRKSRNAFNYSLLLGIPKEEGVTAVGGASWLQVSCNDAKVLNSLSGSKWDRLNRFCPLSRLGHVHVPRELTRNTSIAMVRLSPNGPPRWWKTQRGAEKGINPRTKGGSHSGRD
ncbi:hypothetical protein KM043_004142 [Ampulex compressa]|nr:hypothetical protein KM043_004142 [Ampulex compressa]